MLILFANFPGATFIQGGMFIPDSRVVSSVPALEATEPVSEPVTQMAVELINNHLISVQQTR